MIRIAICDDVKSMTGVIEQMLFEITDAKKIKIVCNAFFDGSTLVERIRQGAYYDLIYLDVEMKKMSGIKAAIAIREMNIPALIVYVSGYEKYLKELISTEPFSFLDKPIDTKKFGEIFFAAYRRIKQRAEYFSFIYNRTDIKIPLKNICYFESNNRVVQIHMTKDMDQKVSDSDELSDRFYGKINDIEKELFNSNSRFLRIHQSYLVNFDYVKSMNFTEACMNDGTVLQISENRQKDVRAMFCAMAGMEARNE